jgi:hypothetical protein
MRAALSRIGAAVLTTAVIVVSLLFLLQSFVLWTDFAFRAGFEKGAQQAGYECEVGLY